ncbi:hypothetical protein QR680_017660 [Steinernema hermaphroditum]|uniref:Uncharacterized protein n=1 Tax=Steinernema hermaphroditum TaxID=289476 RepID=A0AA39HFD2_9BILA|nr:hypothetical protein QR680_017660 [Steinernema hermaphroditum]
MQRCCRAIPFWSVVATVATVVGSVTFCVLIDKGLHGFLYQLGAFSTRVSNTTLHWEVVLIGVSTLLLALSFLLIGIRSTLVTEYGEKLDTDRCLGLNAFVHPAFLYPSTLLAYGTVLVWIVLLSCAVCLLVLYAIFIGVMYTFCATIDNQCFDLTVLLPAVVKYATNNKVDLTFCKDKKDAICDGKHNQTLVLLTAVVCGFVALVGLIHFLMCFSANVARIRLLRRTRKGEHIAMNHGTVDSNSFIMTDMGK